MAEAFCDMCGCTTSHSVSLGEDTVMLQCQSCGNIQFVPNTGEYDVS